MKVRLKKDIKSEIQYARFLEYDVVYEVIILEVSNENSLQVNIYIVHDAGVLTRYDLKIFEIDDYSFTANFIIAADNYSTSILPSDLAYPGFLEDYHNDDPKARAIFKKNFPNIIIWDE